MLCPLTLLLLLTLQKSSGCPNEYHRVTSTTCLLLAQPTSFKEAFCGQKGGQLFGRPLENDLQEGLAKMLNEYSEEWMPAKAYVGMERTSRLEFATDDDTWVFVDESEPFLQSNFSSWFSEPEKGEDCAVVGRDYDFKAEPADCLYSYAQLCEKNEFPCESSNTLYTSFDGHCLMILKDLKSYQNAVDACAEGHLLRMKDKSCIEQVAQAFYNGKYYGGVYVGLKKQQSGKWIYNTGEEEEDVHTAYDDHEFECGAVRLMGDTSVKIYSHPCFPERLWFLCEVTIDADENIEAMTRSTERRESESSHKEKDLMDLVKGNGPWQWLAFSMILLCNIPDGGTNMAMTFMAPNVDHWCARPPHSNMSVKEWRETALPANDTQCSRYVNISSSDNTSRSANGETASCYSWEYDDSTYTSTIVSQWNLVCDREWLISMSKSMFLVGSLLSSTLGAYLMDKFGRKPLVLACNGLAIASGICCIVSNSFLMFAISRLLASAGVTGANQAATTLMVEMVSPKYRPPYTIGRSLAWHVGLLQLPLIAWWLKDWVWMEVVIILPSVLALSSWWLLPESPRWLLAHGKNAEALKILSEAAKANGMEISGDKLKEKVTKLKESNDGESAKVRVLQLFQPELRLRTLTLWYIWSATSFVYFGITYNTNELAGDPFLNFTAYALIEIPAVVLVQTVIQYKGRRAPLAISMACAGVTSLMVHLIPDEFEWLRMSVPLFGKFCITATFSILSLFTFEVFPTMLRNVGYGSAYAISSFASILAPFVRELEHAHHPVFPQILFGLLSITGGGLALLLPETTNLSVPDSVKEASEITRKM